MADILFPPGLSIARNSFRYLDSTGVSRNPYTGGVRTASLGGDRIGATTETSPSGGGSSASQQDRARLLAFIMSMRGRQNRVYLWDHGYRIRGSFPAPELLTNNDFSNGTTGWTATGTLRVTDQIARVYGDSGGALIELYQTVTLTAYRPYVLRAMLLDGNTSSGMNIGPFVNGGAQSSLTSARGMRSLAAAGASGTFGLSGQYSITTATFYEVPWMSLSSCAFVDNQPNGLTYSDQFDNAAWGKAHSSVTANTAVAADGTGTADSLIEDATAGVAHFVYQAATKSAAAQDWCAVIEAKPSTRAQMRVVIGDNATNYAEVLFNLSTGAIITSGVTGTVSDLRVFVTALGSDWRRYHVVASIPASITTSNIAAFYLANGGTHTYSGDGTSKIYVRRGAYAQSGVPFTPAQTTSTATTGTAQTGTALYVKGLPASTNDLLLPGCWLEVITSYGSELKMVTAVLNSDAAGLGYLQFSPPLRGTPADNAAVIINQPMGRFVFAGNVMEWMTDPGIVSAASFEWEEAVSA